MGIKENALGLLLATKAIFTAASGMLQHLVAPKKQECCCCSCASSPEAAAPNDEGWYLLTTVLIFSVLKWIQNPHSWFWDFGADKTSTTHNLLVRQQSSSLSPSLSPCTGPAAHLAITPEGYSRRQSNVFTAKSNAELLGQHSGIAWEDLTCKHNLS